MKKSALIATMLSALLITTAADAGPKGDNGHSKAGHEKNHGKSHPAKGNCPPGLAKQGKGCAPKAKPRKEAKGDEAGRGGERHDRERRHGERRDRDHREVDTAREYRGGDRLPDDYVVLIDPRAYPLGPTTDFVRYGDYLYIIDRGTGNVLNQLGHVSDWGWAWDDTDFANCPPGLAKKNPPCVPPGLARQGAFVPPADPYGIGGHLPGDYHVLIDPQLYDSNGNALYARRGDSVYRIDRDSNQVLDLIGPISGLFR